MHVCRMNLTGVIPLEIELCHGLAKANEKVVGLSNPTHANTTLSFSAFRSGSL